MDETLARTVAELERKLEQLERTVSSIGAGEPPAATGAAGPSWSTPRSRIVDESAASVTAPLWGHAESRPPATSAQRPAGSSWRPLPEDAASPALAAQTHRDAGSAPLAAQPPGEPAPAPHTGQPPGAAAAAPAPGAEELLHFRERLERTVSELTHDYDELLGRLSYRPMSSGPSSTISFARGAPSLDIVDVHGLSAAAARAFESDPAGTTAYGTSVGYPRLRAWIADRHGVERDRVLVTNGSMQADAFLFEHLVRPGDDVVVEGPSYDRTLLSLRQRGAWVHQVPLLYDGIDTEALTGLLRAGSGARPKLAHIIPNFQNPAGYTLSLAKRGRLLELAAEHDFIVFEDDPYVELRFGGEPLPTMLSMDPERVVYASSFSKTVCPGIRVGYLVGPPDTIGAIAQLATNTYISPSMVAQSIAYEFCASGAIERSIATVRAALAERAQTLADALSRELPEAQFVPPQGGYFMWVTLPEGTDVHALHHAAAQRGVSFVKGTDFLLEGGENTLRLAFSGVTPAEIELGVARLAEACHSF
jgi:2-aminoadipate transaminase